MTISKADKGTISMPRGLGRVQLAIVERLRLASERKLGRFVEDQTPVQLACHIYGYEEPREVTDNQLQAIRKALRSLLRYSIVTTLDYRSPEGERRYQLHKRALLSRKLKPRGDGPPKPSGLTVVK
jgi:hypothetical protein